MGVGMIVEAGEPGGSVGVDRIAFAVEKTCAAGAVGAGVVVPEARMKSDNST